MPTFELTSPRGKKITIEAADEKTAMRGAQQWDLEDHAVSEAGRMGLSPDVALRQMRQESGSRSDAVSPKGARGPMQLMPGTARELGVNADDPYANITGGLTYYKKQLDANGGDERRALAAYNAGPGAVARAGGVPNYPETINYVNTIMGPEGAPVARPKPPPLPGQPGAVPVPQMGPGVTMERVGPPTDRGIKAEGLGLLKGVTAPVFNASGHLERAVTGTSMGDAMAQQGAGLRKMLPEGLTRFIDSPEAFFAEQARKGTLPGKVGEFVGNVAGTAFVPGGPVTSSALSGALLSEKDSLLGVAGDAALAGVAGGVVGKGLDMAKEAGTKAVANIPQFMALPALEKAKRELYKQVENAGHVFDTPAMKKLAKDFADSVRADGGPKAAQLIPSADGFAARLTALAKKKGGVSLSKLDKLRSDIYDNLIEKGGAEAKKGYELRKMIDDLMDASSAPFIKEARIANTKFEKVSEVTRRMKSAALAAGRANSGENLVNKSREKLSPMVDPMHSGQVKNLTPDEQALTERIVGGDAVSNGLRRASNLARNKFVSGPIGILAAPALGPWGGMGVMAAIEGTGQGLRAGAEKYTKAQIDTLIKMMSVGGSKQAVKTAQRVADVQKLGRRTAAGISASVAPALAAFQRPEANRKDGKSPNSRARP